MFKKFIYKSKFLFFLLQKYWSIKYLIQIFLIDAEKYFTITKSQSNNEENMFITMLSNNAVNKNFIEIGYHYRELNSVGLIKNDFSGKVIDADIGVEMNSFIMKKIIQKLKKKVEVINRFIDLDNLDDIFDMNKLGCLSIDIDGNDFWILKKILSKKIFPEIIIVEYNASFLDLEISVPYDKNFNIREKHPSLCYHGASLSAFNKLLIKYEYALVKVINGTNAIFVDKNLLQKSKLKKFLPSEIYEECPSRNRICKNTAQEQFQQIKHLPLENV